jgi:glutamate-1-semialdehyde aminotransferase
VSEVLAYGGLHRALLRPIYELEGSAYPQLGVSGHGCEVVDGEGRTFIDWTCAWGPVMLGYRHPAVEEAIRQQLSAGPMLPLMHPIEEEVAEMLVEMVPSAEMVAFGKNGSDVLNAAIRVARAMTGREMILQHGFHGFHDWYACMHGAQGVLPVLREFVAPFPYNDLAALGQLFDEHDGNVAAVVMEPTNSVLPEPGYLEGIRELTRRYGALLIFDEMVTGFRLANGGAQELFGVTPDLTCLGKAMANGMPLAAIVGTRECMQHVPSVGFGMTFRGETLSLAAARAVLRTLRNEPVTEHLARVGSQVRQRFAELAAEAGVRCDLMGADARMGFAFHDHGPLPREGFLQTFILECAAHGVLTNGMLLPSYAHDDEAVERTLEAFEQALKPLARLITESDDALHRAMQAGFGSEMLGTGWIDVMRVEGDEMAVAGWILHGDGWPDVVEFVAPAGDRLVADSQQRPDLAEAFPRVEGGENGGYRAVLPHETFAPNGDWDFTIRALRGPDEIFSCRIRRNGATNGRLQAATWSDETLQA